MFSIFFLPWVVLMLVAAVAVPIALKMDGSGTPSVAGEEEVAMEGDGEFVEGEPMVEGEQVAGQPADFAPDAGAFDAGQPVAAEALSDDDFAEFG